MLTSSMDASSLCGDFSIIILAHRDAVGWGHPPHQFCPPLRGRHQDLSRRNYHRVEAGQALIGVRRSAVGISRSGGGVGSRGHARMLMTRVTERTPERLCQTVPRPRGDEDLGSPVAVRFWWGLVQPRRLARRSLRNLAVEGAPGCGQFFAFFLNYHACEMRDNPCARLQFVEFLCI